MEKIKNLYRKYHEQIAYVFYGGLTTAVNFLVFGLFASLLRIDEMEAHAFREFLGFFGARALSGVIENGGFWIFAERLGYNGYIVKLALAVFVVISNYVLSKFLIFRKK